MSSIFHTPLIGLLHFSSYYRKAEATFLGIPLPPFFAFIPKLAVLFLTTSLAKGDLCICASMCVFTRKANRPAREKGPQTCLLVPICTVLTCELVSGYYKLKYIRQRMLNICTQVSGSLQSRGWKNLLTAADYVIMIREKEKPGVYSGRRPNLSIKMSCCNRWKCSLLSTG